MCLLLTLPLLLLIRYMAPEVLSSQVTPSSDVWSAGVMAHQLLTGRLPFDDHRNPFAPSISAVWRSVLTDRVDYNMPWWKGISDEGKDFVHGLLNRCVGLRYCCWLFGMPAVVGGVARMQQVAQLHFSGLQLDYVVSVVGHPPPPPACALCSHH